MKRASNLTIRILASRLGLSPMAVSFALRNLSGAVSAHTRERVHAEARRLGYAPNPLIGAWMGHVSRGRKRRIGTTPMIAYISGFPEHGFPGRDHRTVGFLQRLRDGIQQRTAELGFQWVPFYGIRQGEDWARLAEDLARRYVSGIILAPTPTNTLAEARLSWDRFCVVAIGHSLERPPMHTVIDEQLESSLAAFDHLVQSGYRRLGMVCMPHHEARYSHGRVAAFLTWQQKIPPQDRIPVLRIRTSEDAHRLGAWRQRHRPDVVVSILNLRLDRFKAAHPYTEPWFYLGMSEGMPGATRQAGLLEPNFEMGVAAANLLAGMLYRHEVGLPGQPLEIEIYGDVHDANRRLPLHSVHRRPPAGTPPSSDQAPGDAPPQGMRITVRDLARRADVSPATVSRVLRHDPRVRAPLRTRVLRAARECGYRHNPLVDAWATQFHETHRHAGLVIAHACGYSEGQIQADSLLRALRTGLVERAEEIGAGVDSFHVGPGGLDAERLHGILRGRNIEAVLWGPFPRETPEPVVSWDGRAVVGIGHSPATRRMHQVLHSRYQGLHRALLTLLEAGYQRPGLVGARTWREQDLLGWETAFLHVSSILPARDRVPWLTGDAFARSDFDAWLEHHRPDVVFTPFHQATERLATLEKPPALVLLEPDPSQLENATAALLHPAETLGEGAVDLLLSQCDTHALGLPARPTKTAFWSLTHPGASCPELGERSRVSTA